MTKIRLNVIKKEKKKNGHFDETEIFVSIYKAFQIFLFFYFTSVFYK